MSNEIVDTIVEKIVDCFKRGGKALIFGCGGLASESNHFAAEFVGKYLHERKALPAISLTSNEAIITAIANDFGFDYVFVRQLEALAKPKDVVIGMSTSGKSRSVLKALSFGEDLGCVVIDWPRVGESTPEIQEGQIKLMHEVCKKVEEAFI